MVAIKPKVNLKQDLRSVRWSHLQLNWNQVSQTCKSTERQAYLIKVALTVRNVWPRPILPRVKIKQGNISRTADKLQTLISVARLLSVLLKNKNWEQSNSDLIHFRGCDKEDLLLFVYLLTELNGTL